MSSQHAARPGTGYVYTVPPGAETMMIGPLTLLVCHPDRQPVTVNLATGEETPLEPLANEKSDIRL